MPNPTLPSNVINLIKYYFEAQQNLVKIIAEKKARGNVTDYHKSLLYRIDAEIAKLNIYAAAWVKKNIPLEYRKGVEEVVRSLKDKGLSGVAGYESFSVLHLSAINVLIQNTMDDLISANQFIGRQARDNIRKATLEVAKSQLLEGSTIKMAQKQLMRTFDEIGINGIQTSNGRYINIASYAEMVSRSTVKEASNRGTMNQAQLLGYDLVKMSNHRTSCKICKQYEGRVYSITGKDTRFPKLTIPYKPPYANIHPRCRHTISVYVPSLADNFKEDLKYSNRSFQEEPKESKEYTNIQNEKRKLNSDRRQYERYKFTLGEEAPSSFNGFRKTKNSNLSKWKELQLKYKRTRMNTD
jgi:hypothetical protein